MDAKIPSPTLIFFYLIIFLIFFYIKTTITEILEAIESIIDCSNQIGEKNRE